MSITADILYSNYRASISEIVGLIKTQKEAAIPAIISEIATKIVPSMMTDVGRIKNLSGLEKRDLIIEAVDLALDKIFEELNKIPEFAKSTIDETVHSYLDLLLPPMIKLLISVENNEIKFNKKISKCVGCYGK